MFTTLAEHSTQKALWRRFNGDHIQTPIKEAVEEAICREVEAGHKLKVCIGTDSQVKGEETEFATVIVFLREGRGGFMFIHNEKTRQKFSIKERMLVEVAKSIEIAYELCTMWTWKYMQTSTPIRTSRAMKRCAKQWAISSEWDLPLKPSRKRLPAPVVPIRW